MSLSIDRFGEFFGSLYQDKKGKPIDPFPWQARLAKRVFEQGWPDCIDLPTASGKTAAIDIAVFVLACQAERETNQRTVGRRIFFTVNRRVIVDEAFERATSLAQHLIDAKDGILKEVDDALRSISGDDAAPPLDIAQLRGGVYRDRAWARSITQPIVVCTTADQLGSRLLFRGYGVSPSMQPVHAALCGCDSLVLLDEAHVTRAFSQTMQLLTRYQAQHATAPAMRFVQMTATPNEVKSRFELDDADRSHPILKARQDASKPASLVKLDKKRSIAGEIVDRAFKALSDTRKAIGVIVNRVQTARDIERLIREEIDKRAKKDDTFKAEVHLVIGRMRPIDRDRLQDELRGLVGPGRPDVLDRPVFVVATQCLEVGADYDFDALLTECASIDALRQRLGRLNRKGRPVEVTAAIVTNDESLKGDDPIYGEALKQTWKWLSDNGREKVDFGITAFKAPWDALEDARRRTMLAPAPDAAVLLPAHLDALCQTSPQPLPSPEVSYFIHGPRQSMADVNICWRADLKSGEQPLWPAVVALLPPTSPECMTVPLHALADWLRGRPTPDDADVPVRFEDEAFADAAVRSVLIWRGSKEVFVTNDPRDLRPGDTAVLPAEAEGSLELGHVPANDDGSLTLDVAERAYELVRRQRIVRVHPLIHPELPQELRDYATSEDSTLTKSRIRTLLGASATEFTSGPEEIDYPTLPGGKSAGLLMRFNKLLPETNPLRPSRDEDDGEGSSIESTQLVPLDVHTKDVVQRVQKSLGRLHLEGRAAPFERAADLHDLGKADVRFQAVLAGLTPYEAMDRPTLLAKSGQRGLTRIERDHQRVRAQLPTGFRHEMLSVELVVGGRVAIGPAAERDLVLHLVAAHHGHARPFAPVVHDDADDETRSIVINDMTITPEQRAKWRPAHRIDSGIAERFWKLTRDHGWWGLAWLESILRLADQQASAMEQEAGDKKGDDR